MKARRGFTLIELVIITSILGVLATTITVNARQAQVRANDSNRVATLRQFQAALALNRSTNGTYWVFRPAVSSRDTLAANVTQDSSDQNRLTVSPANRVAYANEYVGYKGAGWGRVNAKGGQGNYSQPYSISDALIYQGFLSQSRFDPRMTDPTVIKGGPTDLANFNDFNLTLCDANGQIPASPLDAVSYGLFVQLQDPSRYPDAPQRENYCGGSAVGGGWDTITTD